MQSVFIRLPSMLKTKQHSDKCCGYFLFGVNLTRLTLCYLPPLWSRKWSFFSCSGQAGRVSIKTEIKNDKYFPKTMDHLNVKHSNSSYVCSFSILPTADQRTQKGEKAKQQESMQKTQTYCCASNYHKPLVCASVPLSFTAVAPEWQNMCECWHWTCSPQTTEPQEPNNNDNDNTHPCLHRCEVSITGRLGGWLLPVSLTGKGVTGGGKAWRTGTRAMMVGTI